MFSEYVTITVADKVPKYLLTQVDAYFMILLAYPPKYTIVKTPTTTQYNTTSTMQLGWKKNECAHHPIHPTHPTITEPQHQPLGAPYRCNVIRQLYF